MSPWLHAAIDYIDMWIEFQMRQTDQPGCVIAIAKGPDVVHEKAFGVADIDTGERLTERHRFRVASHSKTFTAAGILKLKEQGRLRLEDAAGSFPHRAQSGDRCRHDRSACFARRRTVARHRRRRLFCRPASVSFGWRPVAATADAACHRPGLRAKYSNLAYGLLGLVIEAVARSPTKRGSRERSSRRPD